jgi:hypothetical protein
MLLATKPERETQNFSCGFEHVNGFVSFWRMRLVTLQEIFATS